MAIRKNLIATRSITQIACCVLLLLVALMNVHLRLTNAAYGPDGDLDPTFGEGGIVVTDVSSTSNWLRDIKVQPDGKIVVAGSSDDSDGKARFILARYNDDGSLDSSFGSGGNVVTNAGGLEFAKSLALQPDGKILVAGSAYDGGTDFGLARYNSDGTLDLSFGDDGRIIQNFGGADYCSGIVVQADGKILLAGYGARGNRQASAFCIARYQSNGKKDSSFGDDGIMTTVFSNGFDEAQAVALQSDGKFVLAGLSDINSNKSPIAVARYNSDGSLDTSFGTDGKLTLNLLGFRNGANGVAIQPNGKIVLAGWAGRGNTGPVVIAVARLNRNGSLDTTFGSDGVVTNDLFGRGGEARSLLLQRDGKIVLAGIAGSLNSSTPQIDFAILRYDSKGALDDSFGLGGVIITDFQRNFDIASGIALQPDGKLVAGGYTAFTDTVGTSKTDFALARYNNTNLSSFDICIQDDSNGNILQIDSATGEYKFTACSESLILTGTGAVKVKGCKTTLTQKTADRNVSVTIRSCKEKASATVEVLSSGKSFSLSDSSTAVGACACH